MFIKNGAYLYELKSVLVHSSIKVTERYAHLTNASLVRATKGVADYMMEIT